VIATVLEPGTIPVEPGQVAWTGRFYALIPEVHTVRDHDGRRK
jgi:hypothetical protein